MSMELRKDDKTFPRVTAITILYKNEMYILNIQVQEKIYDDTFYSS
jgi:hypothetical protein